mgnify:CR=1 FL=1
MGEPYEDRAQQSEDVGLYESDQKLQTVHEEEHQDAEDVKSDTEAHTIVHPRNITQVKLSITA